MSDQPQEVRQLSVVKKPKAGDGQSVIEVGEGTIVVRGTEGPLTFACGGCRTPLAVNLNQGQLINLVLKCNACGCYNRTLD